MCVNKVYTFLNIHKYYFCQLLLMPESEDMSEEHNQKCSVTLCTVQYSNCKDSAEVTVSTGSQPQMSNGISHRVTVTMSHTQ